MKSHKHKLCMVSSSGGHWEQLNTLKQQLLKNYNGFVVSEKTSFSAKSDYDYLMPMTDAKDVLCIFKLIYIVGWAFSIMIKDKPDVIISTGALIGIPFLLIGKLFGKKTIFIETLSRVTDGTKTGKLAYKFVDLFIYQWKSLDKVYPKGVYGGCIY